jgi:hypothetical protein
MKNSMTTGGSSEHAEGALGEIATARVNVHVTEAEHQKLKMHAARHKTSIKELIRAYIASLPD